METPAIPPRTKLIGGARIGWFNATWPFASLRATPDKLILTLLFVEHVFPVSEVTLVWKYVVIPFLGWGGKIDHEVPGTGEHIVFWYPEYPDTVLEFLRSQGFPEDRLEFW